MKYSKMEKLLELFLLFVLVQFAATETNKYEDCITQEKENKCLIKINCASVVPNDELKRIFEIRKGACPSENFEFHYILSNITLNNENTITLNNQDDKIWESITVFEMTHAGLKKIPEKLYKSINVQEINISFNKIASLPKISSFINLTKLDVSNNLLQNMISIEPLKDLSILDISDNNIVEFDMGKKDFEILLKHANFSNNKVSVMPELSKFEKLIKLDISHNLINTTLVLNDTKSLVDLDVSWNAISSVDFGLDPSKSQLNTIKLSHNKINYISDFSNLAKLENIDLSRNLLITFDFKGPNSLKDLDVSWNLISSVNFTSASSESKLNKFNLSNNKINYVPDFSNCINLYHLDLSHNKINTTLPMEHLKGLKTLNISNNHIIDFDMGKTDFEIALEYAAFSNNKISITPDFSKFEKLSKLDISHNLINTAIYLNDTKSLVDLDVSWNAIPFVDFGLDASKSQLNTIKLSHNKINHISDFSHFKNLSYLDISYNIINGTLLIEPLRSLRTLNISDNKVVAVDIGSANFEILLEHTDFSNNKINIVPDFNKFTELKSLDLSNNTIKTPLFLNSLKNLISLNTSYNKIPRVDLEFKDFEPQIQYIDLSHNWINSVLDFSNFKKLKKLDLSHNSIPFVDVGLETSNLEDVNLSYNKITSILNFHNCSSLKKLDMSNNLINTTLDLKSVLNVLNLNFANNLISEVDTGTQGLKFQCIKLDLSNNKIQNQFNVTAFSSLKKLNLAHNSIKNKFILSYYKFLEFLDVSNNNISILDTTDSSVKLDIKYMNFSKNKIKRIPDFYFENCENLEKLDLSFNDIERTIYTAQFYGLKKLKYLFLSNNRIQLLGNAFYNLMHLNTLHLDCNNITSILSNDFCGLSELRNLHLSFNKITNIHNNAFLNLKNIESLNLNHNNLTKISRNTFKSNNVLTKLDISYNYIYNIEDKSFKNNKISELIFKNNPLDFHNAEMFDGLLISELDLRNKSIAKIPENLLLYLKNTIKRLDLSNNELKTVSNIPFEKLEILEELDLSNNQLTDLPGFVSSSNKKTRRKRNAVKKFQSLLRFNYSQNKIKQLKANFLMSFPKLKKFICSFCSLITVNKNAFNGANSLKFLDLSHNLLATFDVNVSDLKSVQELNLSDNRLESIRGVKNLFGLKIINLAKNNLSAIDLDTFTSLVNLEEVNLSSNKQLTIDNHFENLSKLKYVYIRNNKEVSFRKSKQTSMSFLDMSSCGINDLGSVGIDKIKKLTVLILQYNNLSFIDINSFKGMNALEEIYLSENNIKTIENYSFKDCKKLLNLNLYKNNIKMLNFSFTHLNNIKSLNLGKNHINEIRADAFKDNKKLENLYLEGNAIHTLFHNAFFGLDHLKVLDLKNNNLKHFGIWYLPDNQAGINVILDNNHIENINFEEFSHANVSLLSIVGNNILADEITNAKLKFPNLNIRWEVDSYQTSTTPIAIPYSSGKNDETKNNFMKSVSQYYVSTNLLIEAKNDATKNNFVTSVSQYYVSTNSLIEAVNNATKNNFMTSVSQYYESTNSPKETKTIQTSTEIPALLNNNVSYSLMSASKTINEINDDLKINQKNFEILYNSIKLPSDSKLLKGLVCVTASCMGVIAIVLVIKIVAHFKLI